MTFYPQQNPYYPPEQAPEYDDYEYEDDEYYDDDPNGDSVVQRFLIFISGGCLVFICMGCCVLMFSGAWVLDPGSSLVSTPAGGGDIGLTFEDPAFPNELIVNDESVQMTILSFNRNVAVPGFVPVEGRELVVVTLEVLNIGEEEAGFSENDFLLINSFEEAYQLSPASASVDGSLGRGKLGPGEGLEGRLTFDLLVEDINPDLILRWESGRDGTPRYIFVQ